MITTDDDPTASWQDRIGSRRKRGRVSPGAVALIPAEGIDVRLGRLPAPERLSEAERALGDKLTFSRRPGWFSALRPTSAPCATCKSLRRNCARPSRLRARVIKSGAPAPANARPGALAGGAAPIDAVNETRPPHAARRWPDKKVREEQNMMRAIGLLALLAVLDVTAASAQMEAAALERPCQRQSVPRQSVRQSVPRQSVPRH